MLEVLLGLVVVYAVIITLVYIRTWNNAQSAELTQKAAFKKRQAMMDATIEAKADEAMRLHQTFQKFVPRQFVEHFAKTGGTSLELGRADEDRVAILFCDIRGFTSLSEKMSPQELMYFLNSYFLRMNAPIHQNNGFIDKFIGDAIMALFDRPQGDDADKAYDAVRAALEIQVALTLYNNHRASSQYAPVKNGIGLHFGPVVLGTVGSDDRMDTTVIGDTVNVAQRIESLCRYFNSDILASHSAILLASSKTEFEYRLLDNIVLKGKSVATPVVEVVSHLPEAVKEQKLLAGEAIKDGIKLREDGYLKTALSHFESCLSSFPNDSAIKHHLRICKRAVNNKEWDGMVRL
ncbi:adenylate/guanylate cyclase domain-containing protein [Glaciecola siphonariae]|uniref:Adenylate/guanylate cyclase domain-containing protein n=1 Tax=Glaciecola siphonariae TaxID=521012 RepID=A0ABV9LXG6_9ALTE